jgi:hypothetical protein
MFFVLYFLQGDEENGLVVDRAGGNFAAGVADGIYLLPNGLLFCPSQTLA